MVTLANAITIGRILAIPIFILLLYANKNTLAATTFIIISLTDALDGWVARKQKTTTRAGAIIDPLADKLLVSAALVFLIGKGIDAWMAYIIIAREFLVTALRLLSEKVIQASWMGKTKTLAQIIAVTMVMLQMQYSWHAMLIATIITIISGIDYFWKARNELKL